MEFQRLAAKESTNKSTHYQSFNLSETVPAPYQIFRILQISVLTCLNNAFPLSWDWNTVYKYFDMVSVGYYFFDGKLNTVRYFFI